VINSDLLPLSHSWPLFETARRLRVTQLDALAQAQPEPDRVPHPPALGLWSCDLATERLHWSHEVRALFGLGADEALTRANAVACYAPHARTAMELLRAYAIRHRRGFTMDAMIRALDGETRWMRLSGVPVLEDGKVVRLFGTKRDVTAAYDGPGWRAV